MLTFRTLSELFLNDKMNHAKAGVLNPKTVAWHRSGLKPLYAQLGERPAAELVSYEVTAIRFTPNTMQSIRCLYRWAVTQRLVQTNPFASVPQPKYRERTRIPTDLEFIRIRREISPHCRSLLWFMRRTGARPGELRNATWSDYDPRAGSIRLDDFKCKNKRKDKLRCRDLMLDPKSVRALNWIRSVRDPKETDPIFPGAGGRPISKDALCRAFARAVKRLRLNLVHREKLVPYSNRHAFATVAIAKGVPVPHLMLLLGQTDIKTTQRYVHPSTDNLRSAVEQANRRAKPEQIAGRPLLRLVS